MIQKGISEHHVVFYGGRIGVSSGMGTSRRGTEPNIPTAFVGFQELVDPQEIGSDVAKGTAEFPPRLFMGFRKVESIDVVIRALKRVKAKLEESNKPKEEKHDTEQGVSSEHAGVPPSDGGEGVR